MENIIAATPDARQRNRDPVDPVSWHEGRIQRAREELRRTLADRAFARELLRELNLIDGAGGGKS